MWQVLFSRRMFAVLCLGFSSGLPLLLCGSTLQAWLVKSGVDIKTIGLLSLVGLPYTLKFIWAPLLDRYALSALGRRKSWIFVTQVALAGVILWMGFQDPASNPWNIALLATLLAFFSATQDIALDAYRRESLADEELGLGSALFINGYRLAMLVSGSLALLLADRYSWEVVYAVMAALMASGIVVTLIAPRETATHRAPSTIREAVVAPFAEYFSRERALTILAFILLYKLGDTVAGAMTTPFILQIGFSLTEYGVVGKSVGLAATLIGAFCGGMLLLKLGIIRSLWIFGVLQALSTLGFSALAFLGHNIYALTAVIGLENITAGMGTSAYLAYMATLTNRQFTATQYALLTSLMGVPRVLAASPSGYLASYTGWPLYFLFCALLAIPGLYVLRLVAPWPVSRKKTDPLAAS